LEKIFDRTVSSLRGASSETASGADERDVAEQQLRDNQRQLRRTEQILADESAVSAIGERFLKAIQEGQDREAAKALKDSAVMLCVLVNAAAGQHPDLFIPLARASPSWPVMLGIHSDAQAAATGTIDRLEVAADTIYGRLRRDRAYTETTVARTYAREVVETIWMNRLLIPQLRRLVKGLETISTTSGRIVNFVPLPEWFRLIIPLPPFSNSSVAQWGCVAREVIRGECSDFHLRPEWGSVRRSFGPTEKGRIQNKILYNILSAMRTIARQEEPKSSPYP